MVQPSVAIVGVGAMGAALGNRLVRNGIRVVTLPCRSAASEERARTAGIEIVDANTIGEAGFFFSVVPSDQAVPLAKRVGPLLASSGRKPLYVDWNAIAPTTLAAVEAEATKSGARFADGGIIGLPPKAEGPGPLLYASGEHAGELAALADYGIRFSILDAPVGAASALKLGYAGITKGLIALGAAMLLAADRNDCRDALMAELASSQPNLFASFTRSIPDMLPKAARWISELEEIAEFAQDQEHGAEIYTGVSKLYRHLREGNPESESDVALLRGLDWKSCANDR